MAAQGTQLDNWPCFSSIMWIYEHLAALSATALHEGLNASVRQDTHGINGSWVCGSLIIHLLGVHGRQHEHHMHRCWLQIDAAAWPSVGCKCKTGLHHNALFLDGCWSTGVTQRKTPDAVGTALENCQWATGSQSIQGSSGPLAAALHQACSR